MFLSLCGDLWVDRLVCKGEESDWLVENPSRHSSPARARDASRRRHRSPPPCSASSPAVAHRPCRLLLLHSSSFAELAVAIVGRRATGGPDASPNDGRSTGTDASGEALLRDQVKAILQKVDEEGTPLPSSGPSASTRCSASRGRRGISSRPCRSTRHDLPLSVALGSRRCSTSSDSALNSPGVLRGAMPRPFSSSPRCAGGSTRAGAATNRDGPVRWMPSQPPWLSIRGAGGARP